MSYVPPDRIFGILNRVKFTILDVPFMLTPDTDEDGFYIQVLYFATNTVTGEKDQMWLGRKWYINNEMTDDQIIKTAYAACKAAVEHEIMESFTVDDKIVFNPHATIEALLSIADKVVRNDG